MPTAKPKKKKLILTFLVGSYIAVMIYSSLFVPVKVSPGEADPDTAYGYCALGELSSPGQPHPQGDSAPALPLIIKINITAWVLQYLFFTLVFISLLTRTLRYFRSREAARDSH